MPMTATLGWPFLWAMLRKRALTLPGVPPEYFMARRLGAAGASGEVSYHPAFAQE